MTAIDQTAENDSPIINTTFHLALNRTDFPELNKVEAQARLELAAAIIAMDAVSDCMDAGEKLHDLHEQAAVERAKDAYAQALADLIRGEAQSSAES